MRENWPKAKQEKDKKLAEKYQKNLKNKFEKILLDLKEPSPEILKIVEESKKEIINYLTNLGINFSAEQIEAPRVFIGPGNSNHFALDFNIIVIGEDTIKKNPWAIKSVLVHELLHNLGIQLRNIESYQKKIKKFNFPVSTAKAGYESSYEMLLDENNDDDLKFFEYKKLFSALNEGITDLLTMVIVRKNDGKAYIGYPDEIKMVNNIVANSYKNDREGKIKFIQAYFSGEMMHLRVIEKEYGKGALRLLANLPLIADLERLEKIPGMSKKVKKLRETRELVFEFFRTKDLERREEIKKIINQ